MSTGTAVATSENRPVLATGGRIQPVIPQTMEDAYRLGKAICAAGMAPRGMETPEKCMVAILRGLEVGLSPMQAVDKIAVVNGRPTIWGDGAMALVRASGLCEFVRERIDGEGDARVAVCETKRRGETEATVRRFSVADAKEAGLWGKQGPWKQFPTRMLQMRARAFALRDLYADVLGGLYLREEIEEDRAERGRQDGPSAPPPPPAEDRPQELAPPVQAAPAPAAPPAPPVEEAEIVEYPSPAEGGGSAGEVKAAQEEPEAAGAPPLAQEEPFDPEAWLDEVRDHFAATRTAADVDGVHEVFGSTANDLSMTHRQRYEDMHQEAEARVAVQDQPEATEVTGEPGPPPAEDEDDDRFPGEDWIREPAAPEMTPGQLYLRRIRTAINDPIRTQASLKGLWEATEEERKGLLASGQISKDERRALRDAIVTRGEQRSAEPQPAPAAPPPPPDQEEDEATRYDREFRARVAACSTIDEINALSPATLVERNRFTGHPLHATWSPLITQRRKQISGIA